MASGVAQGVGPEFKQTNKQKNLKVCQRRDLSGDLAIHPCDNSS
jgi:hypothetical protein